MISSRINLLQTGSNPSYSDSSTSLTNAQWVSPNRITSGFIDCQSHLFFPEVIELMHKRKTDPLVYDREGTIYLQMLDSLRKVPPLYLSVETKLASMDKSGIAVTLLSNNDLGPEWFGHPWVQPAEILEPLRSLQLDPASEAIFLVGNAQRLFQLS
jgi:hypothetical protein